MATTIRIKNALCFVVYDEANEELNLIPCNDVADDEMKLAFATVGTYTTVAITQVDANRGGDGDATGPYYTINLDLSA